MNTTLTWMDFASISPLILLLGFSLVLILLEAFFGTAAKKYSFYLTLVALIGTLISIYYSPISTNPLLTSWLRFDPMALFFTYFFLIVGLFSTLLSASFFQRYDVSQGEYYFLLIASVFGLILIGSAANFLTLFLGLETLSISLYIWCCYMKKWENSQEAAMKYFLMGSLGAAFLLYGIALIYGSVGFTHFEGLYQAYKGLPNSVESALFAGGIAFVTLGFAFKAAIVPFHTWAPDVYGGSPNPVTAFMAVGTKAGAFAAFVVVFMIALPLFNPYWREGLAFLVYPTLIYANYVAMQQVQLRRFFAYSGISHAGFLLIPLVAGTVEAVPALLFYLIIYALATFGCFGVLAYLDQNKEGAVLKDLKGFFHKSPFLASVMIVCLLTLAGIPPTAGFFAKFYIFKVAFQAGYYGLVIVGLLTTILAVYYYLRIVSGMFSEEIETSVKPISTWPLTVVSVVTFASILILSFFPGWLMDYLITHLTK